MSRREQLLRLADALWLTRGYAGFSFADLSRETGLRKPSIHHHFATKSALAEVLIAAHMQRAARFAEETAALPAPQVLDAFFAHYAGLLDQPEQICAAGMICADLPLLSPSAAALGRRYLAGQRRWLVATLQRGPWLLPAEPLADTILGALQGGLQRARADGDPARLTGTVETLRALLAV